MRVVTNFRNRIDGKHDRFAIAKGTLHAAFEGRMERHPRFEPLACERDTTSRVQRLPDAVTTRLYAAKRCQGACILVDRLHGSR
jgi:hypothetical protein